MHDAIVVGARCAGAPTAMLLARQGHRVLLADRASFPSDDALHPLHPPAGRRVPEALGAAAAGRRIGRAADPRVHARRRPVRAPGRPLARRRRRRRLLRATHGAGPDPRRGRGRGGRRGPRALPRPRAGRRRRPRHRRARSRRERRGHDRAGVDRDRRRRAQLARRARSRRAGVRRRAAR